MITSELPSSDEALSQVLDRDLFPLSRNTTEEQSLVKDLDTYTSNNLTEEILAKDSAKMQKISPTSTKKPVSCPNYVIRKIKYDAPIEEKVKENTNPTPISIPNKKIQIPIKIEAKSYPTNFIENQIDSFLKKKYDSSNFDYQLPPPPLRPYENFSDSHAKSINSQFSNLTTKIPSTEPAKLFIPQRDYTRQAPEDITDSLLSGEYFTTRADLTDNLEKLPTPSTNCTQISSEIDWGVTPEYQALNKSSNVKSLSAIKKSMIEAKKQGFSKDTPLPHSRKIEATGNGYSKITPRVELKPSEFEKEILSWMGNVICNHCRDGNDEVLLKYGITAEIKEENCLAIALGKEEWTQDEYFAVKRVEAIFSASLSSVGKINGKNTLNVTINYEI